MLVVTLCAVIRGAGNWVEIEMLGKAKCQRLRALLVLPNRIPSHDTKTMHVRGHWGIENKPHRTLDVTSREDDLRNCLGHSAGNFSRMCRLALNLPRQDQTCKAGTNGKRLKACLEQDYLPKVLAEPD